MSRRACQDGAGILEVLIALVILSGLLGLLVIDQQLKVVVARQGDAVTRQATEMAQLARAASLHVPTLSLASGARVTLGLEDLIDAALLPPDFGGGRGDGIGRTPLEQTYRVEARSLGANAFEVLVWAAGEPVPGRLQRAAVPADAVGEARLGNAVAARLRDQFNLEAAYATRGTAALTAAQHALELALAPLMGEPTLPNNTVLLRVRSNSATSAATGSGSARCLAQFNATCPTTWRRYGPWPACSGMSSNGRFREMGVDLPEGRIRWRLDPVIYSDQYNTATSTWRGSPIEERLIRGTLHPWNPRSGPMAMEREVVLSFNGSDLLRTRCLAATAPSGTVIRSITAPPAGRSLVVCCQ